MRAGFMPQSLLLADTVTIPKPGRAGLDGLRPITLLQSAAKIMERVIYDRLLVAVGHKLPAEQFGFRPKHSCEMLLVELLGAINTQHARGNHSILSSLDLRKAYDSVRLGKMLRRAADFGFPPDILRWLRCWLYKRRLRARVYGPRGRISSKDQPVTRGLPQGGVLSPFLWIVFVADFKPRMAAPGLGWNTRLCLLFADDFTLLGSGSTPLLVAQRRADTIETARQFFLEEEIELSVTKSKCLWLPCEHAGGLFRRNIPLSTHWIFAGGRRWPTLKQDLPGPTGEPAIPAPPTSTPVVNHLRVLGIHIDGQLMLTQQVAVL